MSLITDFKFALRSLARVKGLTITVVATLALGIGANAAIFSVVRGVLLRPLVNKDEDRLIYISQTARGGKPGSAKFSVPEIRDLRARTKSLSAIGEFSTLDFTMLGLGEPRVVKAGVVSGSYFDVMGLRAVRGRLLDVTDDGRNAAGVAVLTHRFWTTALASDPSVIGKTIRLSDKPATIIGVVEPSVPYPAETEIIANIVTSPHHLSATMEEGRVHRMTDLFGRLAPGVDLDAARAELRAAHTAMINEHREDYPKKADFQIDAVRLRDQITSPARTVLLVLLAASGLVFVIACSNVANLILARSVRREGELAVRAALGASTGALRRTLLAESLVLCGAGAALGVAIAWPMVAVLARYAARFSVRALDLSVDATLLWVGVGLALIAAVLLAFVPRLPSAESSNGFGLSNGSVRITSGTNRRLRLFAVTQIAASFLLLAGAGTLLTTLFALQRARTGMSTRNVLALHVPVNYERPPAQSLPLYKEAVRRIKALPGVEQVAVGTLVPWREAGAFFAAQFTVEGYAKADGEEDPRGQFRTVSPGFFASLGVPILAGRDFNDNDRNDSEKVVIVSQSLAQRLFPNQDAVNRKLLWTDPVMKFIGVSTAGRRIVGVTADIDDENVIPNPTMTVYHPIDQEIGGGRLFVHSQTDPYALVAPITKIIRDLSPEQPVERATTLDDVRAEVLAPDRLNALVFGVFAAVALTIAVVGVAGVLAFSVSARTNEIGIRMSLGADSARVQRMILWEGGMLLIGGLLIGVIGAVSGTHFIRGLLFGIEPNDPITLVGVAAAMAVVGVAACWVPALRAAKIDPAVAIRRN